MVTWTANAKLDLRHIYEFIAHDSRFYAKKVSQDIVAKTNILDGLPKIGKQLPELDGPNVRELSIYSYRIIYEIADSDVYVLAVVHKRRDFDVSQLKG